MFGHIKETAKKMLIYGLGDSFNKAIGFLMIPLYTAYLSPKDYGFIEVLDVTSAVISLVLLAGVNATIFRFYHDCNVLDRKRLISTAIICFPGVAFVVLCAVFFVTNFLALFFFQDETLAIFFKIAVATVWFEIFINIFNAFLLVEQKAIFFNIISTIRLLVGLSLNVYFLVKLSLGPIGILWSGFITGGLSAVFGLVYCLFYSGIHLSRSKLVSMLRFGLPLVPAGFGNLVLNFSDRIFLNRLASTADVGIYSLGYKFGMIISRLVTQPFVKIWGTKRFQIYKEDADAKNIFARVHTYYTFLIVWAALAISLCIKEVMILMANERFHGAAIIVPLIAIAYVVRGSYYHFNIGIYLENKTKLIAYNSFFVVGINVCLNYFLINSYGIIGAAVATVLSFVAEELLILFISRKFYIIPYEWLRIAKICLVALCVYFFGITVVTFDNLFVSIFLKLLLLAGFPLFLLFTRFLNEAETNQLQNIRLKFMKL